MFKLYSFDKPSILGNCWPAKSWRSRSHSLESTVLQSIARAFPCNALLHKWGMVSSAAFALCGASAETKQSHIQCLYPALKDASILAHHDLAQRLWKGI